MPDIADSPSAADAASLLRDANTAGLRRDLLRFCLFIPGFHGDDSAETPCRRPCWPPAAR